MPIPENKDKKRRENQKEKERSKRLTEMARRLIKTKAVQKSWLMVMGLETSQAISKANSKDSFISLLEAHKYKVHWNNKSGIVIEKKLQLKNLESYSGALNLNGTLKT